MVSVQKDRLAAIALGGNEPSPSGDPSETLVSALREIAGRIGPLAAVSRFFRTPAFPAGSGPDFVNAAAIVETGLAAEEVLAVLHEIEARHGRERLRRWGARTLDLDLLWLGDRIAPDPETQAAWVGLSPERQRAEAPDGLILPHPRLQDRGFVLIPLAEIAPGWRHPATGQSVAEMADALPEAEKAEICPL
ncbi:2-amino-4-hydroxy-6-hydroxymethyldihydropteridine diphosphokinase [Defluviimonas sp. WL0024]|uniref:2-amino-4-hydroxy-6-hydroxymethyldihydropteridine pyrophosphokinase n=1 Tax=Albidovulum salinarum TaxID=2984153 RepID=A0ABT2X3G2_9RHOB|nr:2-amino-4-hydroxy-6-hydroxymethyldihydropteridine diphosphokinase [Defluviimonas sp. WL0024]MCU9848489.1 2-amino-4-hydroxy-6-hydroxymethyldihydropteridine diphosphokinase [Defluviimonas sp. WL0024]